jgi:secernin
MRIARDHYEGTFLEGPYFDAADPDFLSLCMHVSPAGFTWGNTASSGVASLPATPEDLPVFWWTPGPPCVGCYVPFFVHGSRLPEIVSRAGRFGMRVVPPPAAQEDTFAADSYWWLFRRLLDTVKGDAVGSRPGYYNVRVAKVRAAFDALEAAFAAELMRVAPHAAAIRPQDPATASAVLDDFTAACVERVTAAVAELSEELAETAAVTGV